MWMKLYQMKKPTGKGVDTGASFHFFLGCWQAIADSHTPVSGRNETESDITVTKQKQEIN